MNFGLVTVELNIYVTSALISIYYILWWKMRSRVTTDF